MFQKAKNVMSVLMISLVPLFAQVPLKPSGTQTQLNQDLSTVYNDYKSRFLKSTASGNYYIEAKGTGQDGARCATQSEAHGYGMMIFALAEHDAGSKTIFDGMNQLRKAHPSSLVQNSALMSWVVFPEHVNNTNPSQTPVGPHNGTPGRRNSATDGDLDMAYALLLAYTRWGQESYLEEAKSIINAIKSNNLHPSTLRTNLGDWAKGGDGMDTRPSDWMPGHFRAFYKATNDNFWLRAADTVYALIEQLNAHNSNTGLIPDFATGRPVYPDPNGGGADENDNFIHYSYNACRVPWRIATDFVHNGTPKAETQLNKISSWLRGATGSNPSNIKGGYQLNGMPLVDFTADMPFIAPFAAGMLADAANQNFLNAAWSVIKDARTSSYGAGIQLLCMYLISGNWKAPLGASDGKFPVTVTGGSGAGRFASGENVSITAMVPVGRAFKNWTSPSGVTFADANSAATSFTMPEKAVFVTANFEVIDSVLASNLAFWDSWIAQGQRGIWSVTPNPTNGKVVFNMQTNASSGGNYAWADVLCEFNIGDFENVSSIEITYTSSSALNFVLIDNRGWSDQGLGFTYELPRATAPTTLTINLSQFFRRNDWSSDASTQFKNSDRAYIRGVLFGIDESTTANGEITKLVINGLNVNASVSIFDKPSLKKQQIKTNISIINGKLNFNIPSEKSLSVSICDIRGRLLFSKNIILNSGMASFTIPTAIIGNQTLILNIKGQNGLNLSRKMLVK